MCLLMFYFVRNAIHDFLIQTEMVNMILKQVADIILLM
jgi:hypothetical protein